MNLSLPDDQRCSFPQFHGWYIPTVEAPEDAPVSILTPKFGDVVWSLVPMSEVYLKQVKGMGLR
jgi:hypothetical protein